MKITRYLGIKKRGRGLILERFAPAMSAAPPSLIVRTGTLDEDIFTAAGSGSGESGRSKRPVRKPEK